MPTTRVGSCELLAILYPSNSMHAGAGQIRIASVRPPPSKAHRLEISPGDLFAGNPRNRHLKGTRLAGGANHLLERSASVGLVPLMGSTKGDDFTSCLLGEIAIEARDSVARVEMWHPHQLRHSAATRLRREYGLEAARVILGHSSAAVSELYAEIDHEKARRIMEEAG